MQWVEGKRVCKGCVAGPRTATLQTEQAQRYSCAVPRYRTCDPRPSSTAVRYRTCDLGPQGVLEVAVGHLALYRDQLLVALGLVPRALCLLLSCPLQRGSVLVVLADVFLLLLFLLLVGLGAGT